MKIVDKKITELIQSEYNPRKLSTEQYEQIKSSLLRFSFVDPVIVNTHPDRNNIIIGGHQRTKVWKDLGNDIVPCVELSLTLDQEKELNVRLNKNTGDFDFDMLSDHFEIEDLINWGFDEIEFNSLNLDDIDIEEVDSIVESIDFKINCENLNELEILKSLVGVDGRKANASLVIGLLS